MLCWLKHLSNTLPVVDIWDKFKNLNNWGMSSEVPNSVSLRSFYSITGIMGREMLTVTFVSRLESVMGALMKMLKFCE